MDRQFEKSYERLFLYIVNCSEIICKKIETLWNTHNGGENDRICRNGKIDLIRKKIAVVLMSDWKPFMDFLFKAEKKNV